MAIAIGKLTILVGAGIVGSVLAKEGRMPGVSDVFSGAYKVFFKQIRHEDTKSSTSKPRSDALMAQVNSLRQELQLLASNRPIAIVTSTGSGSSKYSIIIVVVVLGYGYVWWKGWRLPDLMFATKRGLLDACNAVGKQLDNVHASIAKTKRELSSKMDRVESNLAECTEESTATLGEVSELRGDVEGMDVNVQSVHHVVRTLETRISRFALKQDLEHAGVLRLLDFVQSSQNSRTAHRIQAGTSSSSRPALEMPPVTPSRTASLPPIPPAEPPSPSASNGSFKVQRPLQNASIATGLKELYGTSEPSEHLSTPTASNGIHIAEEKSDGVSGSGLFGRRFSGFSTSFLTRTRSAVQSSK